MLTDYKIPRKTHHEDGSWTVILNIYEGEITTEEEEENLVVGPVTRYRRTSLLRKKTLKLGAISEAEVERLCKIELATDETRTPIAEQEIV